MSQNTQFADLQTALRCGFREIRDFFINSVLWKERMVHFRRVRKFSTKPSIVAGVALIVLGILSTIAGTVRQTILGRNMCGHFYTDGSDYCVSSILIDLLVGIWCGILFIIFGLFAFAAGKRPNRILVITHCVTSFLSIIFATILIILSGMNVGLSFDDRVSPPDSRPYKKSVIPCPDPRDNQPYKLSKSTPSDWNQLNWDKTTPASWRQWIWDYNQTTTSQDSHYPQLCYVREIHIPWVTQLTMSCLMTLIGIVVFSISIVTTTTSWLPFCCPPQEEQSTPSLENLGSKEELNAGLGSSLFDFEGQEHKPDAFSSAGVSNSTQRQPAVVDIVTSVSPDDIPLIINGVGRDKLFNPALPQGRMAQFRRVIQFSAKPSISAGVALIVLGGLAVIVGTVRDIFLMNHACADYNDRSSYCFRGDVIIDILEGIWCGISFIGFGLCAYAAGKRPSRVLVILHGITSFLSIVFAIILVIFAGMNVGLSFDDRVSPDSRPYKKSVIPCPDPRNNQPYKLSTSTSGYWNQFNWDKTNSYPWRQNVTSQVPQLCYIREIHIPWLTQLIMGCLLVLIGFVVFIISIVITTTSWLPFCCPPQEEQNEPSVVNPGFKEKQHAEQDSRLFDLERQEPKPESGVFNSTQCQQEVVDMVTSVSADDVPLIIDGSDSAILNT